MAYRDSTSLISGIDSIQEDIRLNSGETPPLEENMITVFAPVDDPVYGVRQANEIFLSTSSLEKVIHVMCIS